MRICVLVTVAAAVIAVVPSVAVTAVVTRTKEDTVMNTLAAMNMDTVSTILNITRKVSMFVPAVAKKKKTSHR